MSKPVIGILGTGVIGASWTSLFLAHGYEVQAYDPAPDAEAALLRYRDMAWPVLEELGLTTNGTPDALTMLKDARAAIDGTSFIQESVPERIELKHALYKEIEETLGEDTIIASSASGLMLSELGKGFRNPANLVLGHPFNPPHLIPLVEVMGGVTTPEEVTARAEAMYQSIGKVTIRVNKEMPGHVANRLQAALWREAIHLVQEGVASVEDVNTSVWAGPGLRWAAMGPTMLFNLAAGEGGLAEFCHRYGPSFHRWWDDLGDPRLDEATAKALEDGVKAEAGDRSLEALNKERDDLIVGMLNATRGIRKQ